MPLATAAAVCVLVSARCCLAGERTLGLAARSSRPARTVALAMAYAFIELRTLVKLAVGDVDGDRLMRDFLTAAYAAARRILDVEVVLDPSSASPAKHSSHEPVIVLSRHCGPGDSVLVAWLLTFRVPVAGAYRAQSHPALRAGARLRGAAGLPVLFARGDAPVDRFTIWPRRWPAGRRCCCFPKARTSPGRGGTPRSPNCARPAGFARQAAHCDAPIRCRHAPEVPSLR